jgi:phosphoenolpyruvate carboxykinase (ATP)
LGQHKYQQKAWKSNPALFHGELESHDSYNVSQTVKGTDACKKVGLDKLGIIKPTTIFRNLTYQELFEHEKANNEGVVAKAEYGETFSVSTGKFTGRSPKDRWLVYNKGSKSAENVDWNDINQPTTPEVFDELLEKSVNYFNTLDKAYVFDCFVGASPTSRKKIRFIHEMAWHFTVINACSESDADWERHNLHSETAVAFDIEKGMGVILGTFYGGENKKGIFSLMNYILPLADPPQLPMHCSANVGKDGDVCLFFGLSGTGKTTLSADPHRALIGDDEHGWDEDGVYNFEGGCYAKTINLSEKTEPDIYRAIHTDALLENVKILEDGTPDYFDTSMTENGRVSYPIFHIDGYVSLAVYGL